MTDDSREQACDVYTGDLAELALGALTGRDRARVLNHVESCPRCAEELEQLSRVADGLVQVAPEIEPPMGFEVRLFDRMGVSPTPAPRRIFRLRRPGWVAGGLTAAAAALAVALGLSLASTPAPTVTARGHTAGESVVSAALIENGESVGRVALADLPRMMAEHDRSHTEDIRALLSELGSGIPEPRPCPTSAVA